MRHDEIFRVGAQQGRAGQVRQALGIDGGQCPPDRNEFAVQAGKLHPADGGHEIAHVVAPTLAFDVRVPGTDTGKALLGVIFHRKQARVRSQARGLGVKGHQAAALAGGDIFDAVKAEADHVPERADPAPVMAAAEGVGRVLHHAQTLAPGKVVDLVQMPGVAGVVHGHDGDGAGGEALFRVVKIQGAGFGQHVAGHGHAARRRDGLEGGHKGQRGHQHFSLAARDAALGSHGIHGQVQGRRARIRGDDLLRGHAEIRGELLFKQTGLIAYAQIAVFQNDPADGAGLGFTHNGTRKTQGHGPLRGLQKFSGRGMRPENFYNSPYRRPEQAPERDGGGKGCQVRHARACHH